MTDRLCSKSGCSAPAVCTLSFDYSSSTAWLSDLLPARTPGQYDLCSAHAERFSVPMGWERFDRRSSTPPLFIARRIEAV